jgi:hypothetical protein
MDRVGLMWLSTDATVNRSTTASLKSNQKSNNSNSTSLPPFLPSVIVTHDPSRAKLITAFTDSIVYTSQVTKITGALEAGQSEGGVLEVWLMLWFVDVRV